MVKVYLDTWVLRAFVSEKASERADAKHELEKLRSNTYAVIVPQVVLGEVMSVILRDFNDATDGQRRLCSLHNELKNIITDMGTCLPPLTTEVFNCAQTLKSIEANLRDTDSLILAHALLDPNSQRLLTRDRTLLDSTRLQCEESRMRTEQLRSQRLKIVDGL
jgi:predicted nucleic acid-binding protein